DVMEQVVLVTAGQPHLLHHIGSGGLRVGEGVGWVRFGVVGFCFVWFGWWWWLLGFWFGGVCCCGWGWLGGFGCGWGLGWLLGCVCGLLVVWLGVVVCGGGCGFCGGVVGFLGGCVCCFAGFLCFVCLWCRSFRWRSCTGGRFPPFPARRWDPSARRDWP
ncbi:hypothetical protein, partial [Pseudomonas syringae group genomosp. 7]|uniref:hypothetical protein n=1 Tax=Pseudomonas syringae group genomosp. 7 TaxID=251699 RepID=UPI0037706E9D